jgi:hypothetical protein
MVNRVVAAGAVCGVLVVGLAGIVFLRSDSGDDKAYVVRPDPTIDTASTTSTSSSTTSSTTSSTVPVGPAATAAPVTNRPRTTTTTVSAAPPPTAPPTSQPPAVPLPSIQSVESELDAIWEGFNPPYNYNCGPSETDITAEIWGADSATLTWDYYPYDERSRPMSVTGDTWTAVLGRFPGNVLPAGASVPVTATVTATNAGGSVQRQITVTLQQCNT